ncbi:MAG TPA: MTH1187 family thiamine-binding protein [Longimicrobiales bacterium]
MLFSLTMFPVGAGDSLVDPVSEVVQEIDRSGLPYEVTGMDTVIEGEWDEVMPVIRRAEQRLREKHDRVYMLLAVDDHEGSKNRLNEAVRDVERRLGKPVSR